MNRQDSEVFDNISETIPFPGKDGEINRTDYFHVAGIGASAGGLEALEQFFADMPSVDNIAFIVIQHLSPDYKSFMPELLAKHTKMKVQPIKNEMQLLPGCVYLNPPGYNVSVRNGRFMLIEHDPIQRVNLSIDFFMDSLAADQREKSIAVILSGTGSDGTRGCRSIKEAGGLVIAQDEKTAKFSGMPKSLISTKICDFILPPSAIPEILLKYTGQEPLILKKAGSAKADEPSDALSQIYNNLKKLYSIDFSLYKQSTTLRCLDRRMRICQIQSIDEYYSYIRDDPEEANNLYNSLLIGVTRFFRDRDAFDIIKSKVIPEILAGKTEISPIRVWIAGCSTGEEAYTMAILFKEHMDIVHKNINVKIFATDVDSNAIEYASAGLYPDSIAEDVSLERLNRYFIKKKDTYQVTKNIREMVIFSIHNVINNPPFHKIDLLSCRNLLIYFQQPLQTRILSTFQFAMETSGYMFLGPSETTGELATYFSTVDAKWKIFKSKETKRRPLIDDFSVVSTGIKVVTPKTTEDYFSHLSRNSWEMEDIFTKLIEECLPPSVLVDENGELVQVCGDADKYLKVPRGRATNDIQRMVPKELSTAIGTAINKVRKDKKTVTYTNIKFMSGESQTIVNLIVKPLFTKKSGVLVLVIFDEIKTDSAPLESVENFDTISKLHERITDLEQELQYTKESLQTSIEEIETSSEELQSANEELLVSNEELHSTNEELQSVNEELIVVNTQYQYKIQELADLNNDMTNFINSTTIGTIFLDHDLCVRKFTPAVTAEVNLMEQDIGRPVSHISHNLKNEDLVMTARKVINSLIPEEKEVQGMNDRWYILKYSPYRTNENIIKGVVISLVDITSRKLAEGKQQKIRELYENVVNMSPFAIFITKDRQIHFSNLEGLKLLQVRNPDQLVGKLIDEYLDIKESELKLESSRTGDEKIESRSLSPVEDKIVRSDGSEVLIEIMTMPVTFEDAPAQMVIVRDITYRKLAEELRLENMEGRRLLEEAREFEQIKSDFFSNLSHELRTPLNVIMSTLQLLESQLRSSSDFEKNNKRKKYINIMRQNCYRQLRLVNNIIDITKMDSGFFELNLQNLNIVNVVENITLSVSEYIKSRSIELTFDTDIEEKIIACDPDSIERIILNLLSNAVKFTSEGGSIFVNMSDKGDSVLISIKDSGVGIPKEKQDMIFDRFRQVDKSLTRDHEGSGIGLSLVKSLIEMHGGSISVESEYRNGSTFHVELPARTAEEEFHTMEIAKLQNNVEKIHLEFSDIYGMN
jgi:two-component system CheB/CheR fusion protein